MWLSLRGGAAAERFLRELAFPLVEPAFRPTQSGQDERDDPRVLEGDGTVRLVLRGGSNPGDGGDDGGVAYRADQGDKPGVPGVQVHCCSLLAARACCLMA